MEPRSESVEMIRRLVSFDTTSRDSNLALIGFVRDYLADLGVEAELSFDDARRKANLFATLGPQDAPGIVLSGHTDVVPVDGQDWRFTPFEVTESEGRLYGRGTCDMKGFIAVALSFAPEFLRRGLEIPLHYAFSYDEEVGCIGVRRLLARLARRPVRPAMCIVGEPTGMKAVNGHKGKRSWRCSVRGAESHSALAPRGVNAVEYAAEMIAFLRRRAHRFRDEGPFDEAFDPPFTTVHTGTVHGGTALNIVPRDCVFEFEVRNLPGDDPFAVFAEVQALAERTLVPEMARVAPAAGIAFEPQGGFPGLITDEDAAVTRLVKRLTGANDDACAKVSFGTEAGLFDAEGIAAVVCGPGDIAQAHRPDEFVTLDQIARCDAFMRRLADYVCAG